MILVLLGTHELPFERLLNFVEQAIANGLISEKVIAQIGNTPYRGSEIETRPFFSIEEIEKLYEECSYIITHGGTGSIINGIKNEKKVIAVPRLSSYHEHNDDHQLEIVATFSEQNYIISCTDEASFEDALRQLSQFNPDKYVSRKDELLAYIETYINDL